MYALEAFFPKHVRLSNMINKYFRLIYWFVKLSFEFFVQLSF